MNRHQTENAQAIARPIRIFAPLLIALALLTGGCAGGTAPDGSIVSINPSTIAIVDANTNQSWNRRDVTLSLKDKTDKPLRRISVFVSIGFTEVPPTGETVRMYDEDGKLVTSPFEAETDDQGNYNFRVDYRSGAGMTYSGLLEARSGSTYNAIEFSVAPSGE